MLFRLLSHSYCLVLAGQPGVRLVVLGLYSSFLLFQENSGWVWKTSTQLLQTGAASSTSSSQTGKMTQHPSSFYSNWEEGKPTIPSRFWSRTLSARWRVLWELMPSLVCLSLPVTGTTITKSTPTVPNTSLVSSCKALKTLCPKRSIQASILLFLQVAGGSVAVVAPTWMVDTSRAPLQSSAIRESKASSGRPGGDGTTLLSPVQWWLPPLQSKSPKEPKRQKKTHRNKRESSELCFVLDVISEGGFFFTSSRAQQQKDNDSRINGVFCVLLSETTNWQWD